MYFQKTRLWFWAATIVALVLLCGALAHAQLADLDLLEDDDRSLGIAVTRAPDPTSGYDTESRSGILLLPVRIRSLNFEGGAGAYFTQSIVSGESASSLQWRVQGGPQFGYLGLQFYVEGFWKQGIDYAGFFRIGEFDSGEYHRVWRVRDVGTRGYTRRSSEVPVLSATLHPADDRKVKGLLLASAEVDTPIFESLRILGTVLPGFDGEHDFVVEPQATYSIGDINIAVLGRFGWERGEATKRYTGLLQVLF